MERKWKYMNVSKWYHHMPWNAKKLTEKPIEAVRQLGKLPNNLI